MSRTDADTMVDREGIRQCHESRKLISERLNWSLTPVRKQDNAVYGTRLFTGIVVVGRGSRGEVGKILPHGAWSFGHSSPGEWSGENCNCFQFRDRSGVWLRTLDIYLMYTQATIRMVRINNPITPYFTDPPDRQEHGPFRGSLRDTDTREGRTNLQAVNVER